MRELRGFLVWSAWVFGPVLAVFAVLAHPATSDYASRVLLAELALLLLVGLVKRDDHFAVPAVLLLFQALTLPTMRQMVQLASMSASMGSLTELRESVAAYQKKEGHPPASLADLGPVPPVEIWARDADGRSHYHAPSNAVQVLALAPSYESGAAPAGLRDAGGYAYDPKTGRLALACTGLDPKLGRPYFQR